MTRSQAARNREALKSAVLNLHKALALSMDPDWLYAVARDAARQANRKLQKVEGK